MGAIYYLCSVVVLLSLALPALGATWYIRADGGDRSQCTGLADAPFPGGFNGPYACALSDYRMLYDNRQYNVLQWIISGGDTIILDNTKFHRVGWDSDNGGNQWWCAGWSGGPYGCFNPYIPAGTAQNPTRIYGRNHGNCSIGSGQFKVPDPSKVSTIVAGFGVDCALDLSGTQHVEVQCLEFTRHSQCAQHGSPIYPYGCSNNLPLDDYASNGICTSLGTSNALLKDVWTHGFTNDGVHGAVGGLLQFDTLRIGYNGNSGWNFDDGYNPEYNGVVNGSHLIIEFSGCNQAFPSSYNFPAISCYDQDSGGYGDGMGTPGTSNMTFICDQCAGMFNTQDAFDLGHNSHGNVVFTNSITYGNMGGTYKSGGNILTKVYSSISVGNCRRMAEPIPGAPSTFNTYLSLFCRAAGDEVSGGFWDSSYFETIDYEASTFAGYGATMFDISSCDGCASQSSYVFRNNLVYGLQYAQYNDNQAPGVFYGVSPTVQDHNIFYGARYCPTLGTADQCPVDPKFISEPPTQLTSEAQVDSFNFGLAAGSPAIHTGAYLPQITSDMVGNARSNPPSRGALEYGSQFTIASYLNANSKTNPPTFAEPKASSVASLGYLGCYVDNGNPHDLPNQVFSGFITIERCQSICQSQGYAYAGLQSFFNCFCGNSYGSQGKANESDCNSICTGNRYEICGGTNRNSVYKVGKAPATPAPTPAPTKATTPAPTKAPTPAPTKAPTPAPTKAPTAAPTSTPNPCASAAVGQGSGLRADYFTGQNFDNYVATQFDPNVDFNWGSGAPAVTGMPVDNFSVRWQGQVFAPYSGVYTIYVSSDDGTRLYVNGQLVIDAWVGQAETERSATVTMTKGQQYSIVLEYFEAGGQAAVHLRWSHNCIAKQAIPQQDLYHTGVGMTARYYNNTQFEGNYILRQVDASINFNWGQGAPAVFGSLHDNFAIVWDGFVTPTCTGTYTFYTFSEDGNNFYENFNQVVQDWNVHSSGPVQSTSPTFSFTAGQLYPISVEYFNQVGNAQVSLSWSATCTSGQAVAKQVIPQAQLYPLAN